MKGGPNLSVSGMQYPDYFVLSGRAPVVPLCLRDARKNMKKGRVGSCPSQNAVKTNNKIKRKLDL